MNSIDRRVRRSKKLLSEALIALTLEKNYEEITIQDITEQADVGYRTFFRHYTDKDALLNDVVATTMMELRELISPPLPEIFATPELEAFELTNGRVIFQHVQQHSDLYRVLLRSERSLMESIMEFAIKEIKTNFGAIAQSDIPFSIIANHIVSSTIALIRWWLDHGMTQSVEDMGKYYARLIIKPTRETIVKPTL